LEKEWRQAIAELDQAATSMHPRERAYRLAQWRSELRNLEQKGAAAQDKFPAYGNIEALEYPMKYGAETRVGFAWVLYKAGRKEESMKLMLEAMQQHPSIVRGVEFERVAARLDALRDGKTKLNDKTFIEMFRKNGGNEERLQELSELWRKSP
jgi:hypothetical protein